MPLPYFDVGPQLEEMVRRVEDAAKSKAIKDECRAYSNAARDGLMPDTWYSLSLDRAGDMQVEEIDAPDYSCGGVETDSTSYWEACKALLGVGVEDAAARRAETMERIALDTEMFSSFPGFTFETIAKLAYCEPEPDMMSAVRDIARSS